MLEKFRAENFGRMYSRSRGSKWRLTSNGQVILVGILISGVIGIDVQHNLSFQIFSILTALIFVAILFSKKASGQFSVLRNIPTIATVNTPFDYHVTLTNNSDFDFSDLKIIDKIKGTVPTVQEFVHFHDPLGKNENSFDRKVGFPRWARLVDIKMGAKEISKTLRTIVSKQTLNVKFSMTPLRRGYIYFDHFSIGLPDTFGLLRQYQSIDFASKLLVYPKRYKIPSFSFQGKKNHHPGGIPLSSITGETKEFHALRDYRPGDPLRNIHWRSWARTGAPVVKTFEQEYFLRHSLILDTYSKDVPSNHFEEAVSVATSFAMQFESNESLLELMFVQGKQYHITTGRQTNSINLLLEVLACVEPDYETSFSELSQLVNNHAKLISSTVCIFLKWNDERKALVKNLQSSGINVVTLIIGEPPESEIENSRSNSQLIYLQAGDIETGLSKLKALH